MCIKNWASMVPGGVVSWRYLAVSWRSSWRSHWGALLVTFDNVGFGAGWHVAECCKRRKQIVVCLQCQAACGGQKCRFRYVGGFLAVSWRSHGGLMAVSWQSHWRSPWRPLAAPLAAPWRSPGRRSPGGLMAGHLDGRLGVMVGWCDGVMV